MKPFNSERVDPYIEEIEKRIFDNMSKNRNKLDSQLGKDYTHVGCEPIEPEHDERDNWPEPIQY